MSKRFTIECWQDRESRWWRPGRWRWQILCDGEFSNGVPHIQTVICMSYGCDDGWPFKAWTRERALRSARAEVARHTGSPERDRLTTEVLP